MANQYVIEFGQGNKRQSTIKSFLCTLAKNSQNDEGLTNVDSGINDDSCGQPSPQLQPLIEKEAVIEETVFENEDSSNETDASSVDTEGEPHSVNLEAEPSLSKFTY